MNNKKIVDELKRARNKLCLKLMKECGMEVK